MEFAEERIGEAVVVRLKGRLDSSTADPVRERFMLVPAVSSRIAIDLSGVHYISSAGLQVLLGLARKIHQQKGKLVLFGIVPDVAEILSISGFDKIFTIRADNASAVAALR